MTVKLDLFPTKFAPSSPNNPLYNGLLDENGEMYALDTLDLFSNRLITLSNPPLEEPGGVLVDNTGSVGVGIFKDVVDGTALLKKLATDPTNFVTVVDDPGTDSIKIALNKDSLAIALLAESAIKTALDGKVGLVNGKIPNSLLDIDGVDYFGTVANQAAMLALDSTVGDWCHRADILGPTGDPEEWVCVGTTPHVLASWKARKDVVAGVSAVNGKTGAINITAADLDLGKVQNFSISEMINLDASPLKSVLAGKADSSAVAGLARSAISLHATTPGLLSYNSTTGVLSSGFTQTLKTAYDDAVTAKHSHTNKALIDSITQEMVNAWNSGTGENPTPAPTVDRVASQLLLTSPTTVWNHTPAKPNRYALGDKATTFAPDQVGEGNSGTIDFIMDGTGGHEIKFAGIAPDNYPGVDANKGAYAMWLFSWYRDRTSMVWGAKFKGFGSNKLATPVFTATDLGATGTQLQFPLSAGANRYTFTRVTKANYDSAIAGGTAISWGGSQIIDVAPYSPFVLKRDSTQTGSSSYMPAGTWYLRLQAIDTTNAKQASDFYIVGPFTKS